MIEVTVAHENSDVRSTLSRNLESLENVEVIKKIRKASNFFEKLAKNPPDVLILGMKFGDLSGLDMLDKLMRTDPVPVLAVSAGNEIEKEEAVKSLSYGAVDILSPDQSEEELDALLHMADRADKDDVSPEMEDIQEPEEISDRVVIIGSSTGGPGALEYILTNLPELSVPVLVAQHMSANYTSMFSERLDAICDFRVKEAEDGEKIEKGVVYFAPGNKDMKVLEGEKLAVEDPSHRTTPSINELFRSSSEVFGQRAIGIILTGMGKDGVVGSRFVKSEGGRILVQDRDSSKIYGIGKHVINQGDADRVLALKEIPQTLIGCL